VIGPKPHRNISHSLTTPTLCSNTLPHHSSGTSVTSSPTTRQRAESLPRSKSPHLHTDLTASLPCNFNAESNLEPPLPPRTTSLRPYVSASNVNASNPSSHSSSPPKVNNEIFKYIYDSWMYLVIYSSCPLDITDVFC